MGAGLGTEAAEHDALNGGLLAQTVEHGGDGDACGTIQRKAVDAGRDRREGDGCETLICGERQAVSIAGSEQQVLTAFSTVPDRPNRVDHVARRQPEARRDLRLSSLAAAKPGASLGELMPRGTVDGAADASARGKHLVGGIDDGVDVEPGDVAFDNLDAVQHDLIGDAEWPCDQAHYSAGGAVSADAEAEEGFTERIQAMIFHRSSSLFTTLPMAGIGPTTFSEPLRL